jgi:hypothetical protein
MPGPSETLPVFDQRLAERLLAFELLDEAWPRGRTANERAKIGRQTGGWPAPSSPDAGRAGLTG